MIAICVGQFQAKVCVRHVYSDRTARGGIRTHTVRILSPLPLPLGYAGGGFSSAPLNNVRSWQSQRLICARTESINRPLRAIARYSIVATAALATNARMEIAP